MIDNRLKTVRKVKAVWYAWYPGDYAAKTATLTMVEDGAYRRLLDHYYQMNGVMVANATILLRVCRAFDTAEQEAVRAALAQFFVERDGYYHHERADAELEKRRLLSEKRALAGSKGGQQKVANATNLLGVCQTQSQSQSHIEETTLPPTNTPVAIATPPDGGEVSVSFGKKPKKKPKANGLQMAIPDDEVGSIMHHWNAMAEFNGLSQVKMLTATRKQKIQARLSEFGGLEPLSKVIDAVESQQFLLGKNGKGWKIDFDWLMEPSNIAKVAEMKYTNGGFSNGRH